MCIIDASDTAVFTIFRDNTKMSDQARTSRVIISLVASMTVGALVLMALDDNNSLSAGPFSLASYTNLDPIEQATSNRIAADIQQWDYIEVFYSRTKGSNIGRIVRLSGLTSAEDLNFHFLVCNGIDGVDGKIQAAAKWHKQRTALGGQDFFGNLQTIRICVVADGAMVLPTDCQVKRSEALVEALARKFNIPASKISYPANWKL